MIDLTHDAWRVVVSDDDGGAAFPVDEWLERSFPASALTAQRGTARAVVEVRRRAGGLIPRAVAGGEMRLRGEGKRSLRVGQSAAMTLGAQATYSSRIRGILVPGLPPAFANAVLDGLVAAAAWESPGVLIVDRGAYDEVESAPLAFKLAADVLVLALLARLSGTELDLSSLRRS
jgi:hypothetical protein